MNDMNEERNYDDPRLSEEMRHYGCYTLPSNDPKRPYDAKIYLTPEFLANTKGYAFTMDMGFGKERCNSWTRNANGVLEFRQFPDRLFLDEEPGEGKYTVEVTLTCECGERIALTHDQVRIFIRGALEQRYLPKVLLRCPKCNKMLFKP
jgi:hypothetical protein|nr:MAG TPA: zinc-ribbon containing domain protein [Bacteriophage sp.]